MSIKFFKVGTTASTLAVGILLAGCSLWPWGDDQPAYMAVDTDAPLEVPPDLSEPADDPTMRVPQINRAPLTVDAEPPRSPTPPNLSVPSVPVRDLPHSDEGVPYLVLEDSLASAWRRTGLALERSGFTIEERDEIRWLYSIVYLAPAEDAEDEGFFGWLFGDDEAIPSSGEYRVSLVGDGKRRTRVVVLDAAGNPVDSRAAEQILSLLADRLLL